MARVNRGLRDSLGQMPKNRWMYNDALNVDRISRDPEEEIIMIKEFSKQCQKNTSFDGGVEGQNASKSRIGWAKGGF